MAGLADGDEIVRIVPLDGDDMGYRADVCGLRKPGEAGQKLRRAFAEERDLQSAECGNPGDQLLDGRHFLQSGERDVLGSVVDFLRIQEVLQAAVEGIFLRAHRADLQRPLKVHPFLVREGDYGRGEDCIEAFAVAGGFALSVQNAKERGLAGIAQFKRGDGCRYFPALEQKLQFLRKRPHGFTPHRILKFYYNTTPAVCNLEISQYDRNNRSPVRAERMGGGVFMPDGLQREGC